MADSNNPFIRLEEMREYVFSRKYAFSEDPVAEHEKENHQSAASGTERKGKCVSATHVAAPYNVLIRLDWM